MSNTVEVIEDDSAFMFPFTAKVNGEWLTDSRGGKARFRTSIQAAVAGAKHLDGRRLPNEAGREAMSNCSTCQFYKSLERPESEWWAHWGNCFAPIPLKARVISSQRVREDWKDCPSWQRNESEGTKP